MSGPRSRGAPPELWPARDALRAQVGQEVHVGSWLSVEQARIDRFAEATDDHQWIHVDHERAARESPWGGTIAHGFLTLSLITALRRPAGDAIPYPGVRSVINYGLNRVRFMHAVRSGSRLRVRASLLSVEEVPGGLELTERITVEIEGQKKPACLAEVIYRLYP